MEKTDNMMNSKEIESETNEMVNENALNTNEKVDNEDTKPLKEDLVEVPSEKAEETLEKEEPSEENVEEKAEIVAEESGKESDEEGNAQEQTVKTEEEEVEEEPEETEEEKEKAEQEVLPDYNQFSLDELLTETNKVVNAYQFGESKKKIDVIKSIFYTKIKEEQKTHEEAYLEKHGNMEGYKKLTFSQEETFYELIKIFRKKRAEAIAVIEKEKEANYKLKSEIIENISHLVNSTEHFNTVYNKFKALQEEWRAIQQVPSNKLRELNSQYQFALNKFYDYLNINKELRELDLKKNLSLKEQLCERAEGLAETDNPKTAFVELQNLHQNWKDIGPVTEEKREALWERFKAATKAINNKFQELQVHLKEVRAENLSKKEAICVEIEELIQKNVESPRAWDKVSEAIIDFQKRWRKIGMVPAKHNDEIYKRFKEACDQFFDKKNKYFKGLKKQQKENLDKKTALVEQVEALMSDENWKETSLKIIQIQKEWRKVGPVPRKKTDAIWKRFRTACDTFFNNKEQHFQNIHGDEKENYQLKMDLIKEIEDYKQSDDTKACIQDLKEFQKRWAAVGFVPIKKKTEVQDKYRTAINSQFDKLNIDVRERDVARLKVRLEQHLESPNAKKLIFNERNKLATRIKTVEADIQQFENNIGFFSSGTAKGLLKEYENKIAANKKNLEDLKAKLAVIDKYIEEN